MKVLTKEEIRKINAATSREGGWKLDLVKTLLAHPGMSDVKLFDTTRPEDVDWNERNKKNSVASEWSRLRRDGLISIAGTPENRKIVAITEELNQLVK